ncbi:MAG: hypothetical protein QOJ12_148 [Thermoleophilales bacterium]|nr:hypothetical protein [Thermoleophilales bacterium]
MGDSGNAISARYLRRANILVLLVVVALAAFGVSAEQSHAGPVAPEVCNGIDDDGNGQVDEGVKGAFFVDSDGDGFGSGSPTVPACSAPSGHSTIGGDSNASDHRAYPGSLEICNGADDNSNGAIDEGLARTYWSDQDGDGYGYGGQLTVPCTQPGVPAGYTDNDNDTYPNDSSRPATSGTPFNPTPVISSFRIADAQTFEGDSGSPVLAFTVSLEQAPSTQVTVDYATADGSAPAAVAGTDYTATSGTLTFAAGERTRTIEVPITPDTKNDVPFKQLVVNLSNPTGGRTIEDAQALGRIANDDRPPLVSIGPVLAAEGSGPSSLSFDVTLGTPSKRTVTVSYTTRRATATSPDDYADKAGTVTFDPGDVSETITVDIVGDNTMEANEFFRVYLTATSLGRFGTSAANGTITNDDQSTISVADASFAEGDSGTQNRDFTVALSAPSDAPVTVHYATANGTATSGSDYTAVQGNLTFDPGQTSKTVPVAVAGDTTVEPDETVQLNLTTPSGATIVDGAGVMTITNDDLDPDGDTVASQVDNCPAAANPDQANNDNDSQGDVCDPDDDNDSVPDSSDNCAAAANADQANNDNDSQGDVCDPDDDNDSVPDSSDNCPSIANQAQTDSDGNGTGDACQPPPPPPSDTAAPPAQGPQAPAGPPNPRGSDAKATCKRSKAKRSKVKVTCSVRLTAPVGSKVTARLTRGRRVYASATGGAPRGTAALRLEATRAMPAGSYTITVTVMAPDRQKTVTQRSVVVR